MQVEWRAGEAEDEPSRWQQRMAETRRTILGVALDLFERHGYDEVSVAEVAAAAGVGERTVYRYFGSKEGLVLGNHATEFAEFAATLHRVPSDVPVAEALALANRAFVPRGVDVELDGRRLALVRTHSGLRARWIEALTEVEPLLREWLAARTRRTTDDVEIGVAAAVLVAVHRYLVETWDGTDADTYLERSDRALRLVDHGLDDLDRSNP